MLAPALTVFILFGYVGSLWWLLRRESALVLVALLALCGVSASLRLVYTTDYPTGLDGDEAKILHDAAGALREGNLFVDSQIAVPVLLTALFQAQLVPVVGPNRWAIRTHSLVTSVLSTPAAFAVARALGLGVIPSLSVGAFVAVLPWSLFYGRISQGGELVFAQLLLLAAIARLVSERGGWPEVLMGSFGLCLLLYSYWCGRAMVGMPLVGAILARGRRRILCLVIPALALLGWWPYLSGHPPSAMTGFSLQAVEPAMIERPIVALDYTVKALVALVSPTGIDYVLTLRSACMHPWPVLILAVLGVVAFTRRSVFLVAGFLGGLAPTVASSAVSSHRMLMAFPFIALAAGAAFERLGRTWQVGLTVLLVPVIGFQSVRLYFSPEFWLPGNESFEGEKTALVEALPMPPHPKFVLQRQLTLAFAPRMLVDSNFEILSVENWFPPPNRPTFYAFEAAPLRSFYENLFGYQRIQSFGRCFVVKLEANDWSWLQQHGWSYEARCGDTIERGQVPTLFHLNFTFDRLRCAGAVTHTWRARWQGGSARLRISSFEPARVETVRDDVVKQEDQAAGSGFPVDPGTLVKVSISGVTGVNAALFEITPAGEKVPAWESVTPSVSDQS
ncbi:MAG TPA: hypothetical protein VL403_17790 [Candidatus Kryptonia bacterium]|nr:hypothetical protein [Candidatus Kryptonia bacterium]